MVRARARLAEAWKARRTGRRACWVALRRGRTRIRVVEIGVIAVLRRPLSALHPLRGPPVGIRLAVSCAVRLLSLGLLAVVTSDGLVVVIDVGLVAGAVTRFWGGFGPQHQRADCR